MFQTDFLLKNFPIFTSVPDRKYFTKVPIFKKYILTTVVSILCNLYFIPFVCLNTYFYIYIITEKEDKNKFKNYIYPFFNDQFDFNDICTT